MLNMASKSGIFLTKESKALIKKLTKRGLFSLRSAFKSIGDSYRKEIKLIFDKQQPRDAGLRWAPLSQRYAEWKAKHFPGKPILVRTGSLKDSMTKKGSSGNITLIGGISAVFGSDIDYGVYHDKGKGHQPKRNFSEPSKRRIEIFTGIVERSLRTQFQINGIDVKGALLR